MLDTIKSSSEVSVLFNKGKRLNTPYMTVLVMESETQHGQPGRVVFIAGKKQGNAVWRNRAKRRMRAVCRDLNRQFTGYDVGFVAKRGIESAPYEEMVKATANVLDRFHIR